MKKNTWFSIITLVASILITVPFDAEATMTPKEAVDLIEKTFSNVLNMAGKNPELKKNIVDPTREFLDKSYAGRYLKLFKKVVGYIENLQLAASLLNDVIQVGLNTNERQFATDFSRRFQVYLKKYTTPREWDDFLLDHRFNESDLQTVLFDLGRNFYKALDRQTNKAQLKEAGVTLQNLTPAQIGREFHVLPSVQQQLNDYQRDALEQSRKKK